MPSITSANLAEAIVAVVAAEIMPPLVGQLIMANLVNRDFEPSISEIGATVNVPIPPTLVANNVAETGSVQTQNPNLGNAQISLDQHVEATFVIPDVTKALTNVDLLKVYMEPAINALAERVETDLLSLATSFTANTPQGAYNTALTESTIDSAETALFNSKVPQMAQKHLVVSGAQYSNLRQISRFSEYRTAGEAGLNALTEGQVGRLKSFYVWRSQFVPASGTNTTNLAFHRNAIGMAVRRLAKPLPGTGAVATYAEFGGYSVRIVMSYNPNTLAQQFTVDIVYGVGPLRNNHAVQVRS